MKNAPTSSPRSQNDHSARIGFNSQRQLERVILHLDIDCFFAQVEQLDHPGWYGQPVIVGGRKIVVRENEDEVIKETKSDFRPRGGEAATLMPSAPNDQNKFGNRKRIYGRGVVCTSSSEARARGVRTAMPMAQAVALCPEAICVTGNYQRYDDMSRAVFAVVHEFSPSVKMASIDEAYLDLTGLERWTQKLQPKILGAIWEIKSGNWLPIKEVRTGIAWPIILAAALKNEIHQRTGINVSIGIGPNVFIAKVGSAQCKPNGILYLNTKEAAEFARQLPVQAVPGIGAVTTSRLQRYGINTLADVLKIPLPKLVTQFGNFGHLLYQRARGRSGSNAPDSPAERKQSANKPRNRRSLSRETTFNEDLSDRGHLLSVLGYLTERVGWGLRREALQAGCISVKVRFADFNTLSRDQTLTNTTGGIRFTDLDDEIYATVCTLFDEILTRRHGRNKSNLNQTARPPALEPVRLLGVRLSHLSEHAPRQWKFEEVDTLERRQRLLKTADKIRTRFGFGAVALGRSINLIEISRQSGVVPDRKNRVIFSRQNRQCVDRDSQGDERA